MGRSSSFFTESKKFVYINGNGSNIVDIDRITFIESISHEGVMNKIRIHMDDKKFVEVTGTLNQVIESSENYIRVNRRFCINENYIDRLNGFYIYLSTGDFFLFSRRMYYNFMNRYKHKEFNRKTNKINDKNSSK